MERDSRSMSHPIMGVNVHAVDMDTAVDNVIRAAEESRPFGVSAIAVHGVVLGSDDPELRYRINALELVVPDGQPVRWALNWLHGTDLADRVVGPELMWNVCARAEKAGLPIFLFGSEDETLRLLETNLTSAFPQLILAGSQASRFRPATESEAATDRDMIRSSGAKIVFVGLGCPRQEVWVYENRLELSKSLLAVGAAFDYHAGLIRRAPVWMQRFGLEWCFRLLQEPERLWRRYVLLNPRYVAGVLLQRLGLRTYDAAGNHPQMMRPS